MRKMKQWIALSMLLTVLLTGCAKETPTLGPELEVTTTVPTQTTTEETTVPPTTEETTVPPTTAEPTVPPTTAEPTVPPTTAEPTVPPTTAEPTVPPTTAEPTVPPTTAEPTQPPETKPKEASFLLSFAGDCTFGDHIETAGAWGTFTRVVKDKYDYPFANVKVFFENDDYTFVNLEGPLTDYPFTEEEIAALEEKKYRFKGPAAYVNILLEGDVEHASFANNHSLDYGTVGRDDTANILKEAGIDYNLAYQSHVFTTDSGLKVGVYTPYFSFSQKTVNNHIESLRKKGAEVIVVSIHWGKERIYQPSEKQVNLAHMAIDAGADIVYGHHSHTLMPIEHYKDGVIFYSLGNFSFGGNRNPDDKDTAVIQQEILRHEDGTVELGELTVIPCRLSSITSRNNFQPTPYSPDDPHYARTLSKLNGTYEGTYEDNAKT